MTTITHPTGRWLAALVATALVLALMVGGDQPQARAIGPGETDIAYVADGYNFPDALMGATLAALNAAPMLGVRSPTTGDVVPPETAGELDRLTNDKANPLSTIYVFGGPAAVSDKVVGELGAWADDVQRIFGQDRFGTMQAISEMLPTKVKDSDLLDGMDSSDFLGATDQAADSELLDGMNSSDFLGATAKAADSERLDGLDGSAYQRAVVPSGQTLIGTWYHDIQKPDTGGDFGVHMPFSNPLAVAPTNYAYVPPGTPAGTVTGCPGTVVAPTADAGYFCMYAAQNVGLAEYVFAAGIDTLPNDARRYGASALAANDGNAGDAFGLGVWAVHVPAPSTATASLNSSDAPPKDGS